MSAASVSTAPVAEILSIAETYYRDGIQLLPLPRGEKAAREAWKQYRDKPQTWDEVQYLFGESPQNIAWLQGGISKNLVCIDFDAPGTYQRALYNSKFARIAAQTTVSRTAGRNGYHVSLRTPVPCKTSTFMLNGHKVGDIKGEGSYTLEPNSYLRESEKNYLFDDNGYRGILTVDSLDAIGFPWLEAYTPKGESPLEVYTGDILEPSNGYALFKGLGTNALKILSGQWKELGFASRSEAEFALLVRCAGLGWSAGHVLELIHRFGDTGLKARNEQGWFKRAWEKALYRITTVQGDFDRRVNGLLSALQDTNPFEGRSRWTDKAVTIALLEKAREAGPLAAKSLGVSIRELEERAGVGFETVRKATKRLGLQRTAYSWDGVSARYNVEKFITGLVDNGISSFMATEPAAVRPVQVHGISLDASRSKAFGKSLGIICRTTIPGARGSADEWAKRWDMGRNTATRRLDVFVELKIMECKREKRPGAKKPVSLYIVSRLLKSSDLDGIAEKFGTKGDAARAIKRHEAEREAFDLFRVERKAKPFTAEERAAYKDRKAALIDQGSNEIRAGLNGK